jgi:serine/threonine protein kinase
VVLKSKIAEGGMAGVYLGWHTRLRFPVAVKILKDPTPANLPQFLREARLTVSVDHPNLVRVFDVNVEPRTGLHYIIMEHVEGCSAYQLLRRQLEEQSRPLTPLAALEIGLCTARALGAAHRQGIVHRDVKSDNILIRERDGAVKLADLGFAGRWEMTSVVSDHRHSTVAGTTGFLSPEVLRGEDAAPAADVYGLGATLYELLSGWLPHGAPYDDSYYYRELSSSPAPDVRTRVPSLDDSLAKLLSRCLEANPQHRYADGDDLADAVEGIVQRLAGSKFLRTISPRDAKEKTKPVVLCVDDDEGILELLKDVLEAQGFQPVCFASGDAALANIAAIQPDVAVVDLNMPIMNGLQLCEKLRQVDGYQELAVLILSGERGPEAIQSALKKGITDYLVKPVNSRELVVRVQLLTKLRAMSNEKRSIESQLLKLKQGQRGTSRISGRLATLVRQSTKCA